MSRSIICNEFLTKNEVVTCNPIDIDGDGSFNHNGCDCCHGLATTTHDCHGYNEKTNEVVALGQVCHECLCYFANGDEDTLSDEQFKQDLESITLEDIKRYRRDKFKKQHDAIVNTMTTKQYFKWHNNFFKGELDYKSMAWSIYLSTRSKKIQALCMTQIEFYDQCFGTKGLETLKSIK
jgi:hypothetical protein